MCEIYSQGGRRPRHPIPWRTGDEGRASRAQVSPLRGQRARRGWLAAARGPGATARRKARRGKADSDSDFSSRGMGGDGRLVREVSLEVPGARKESGRAEEERWCRRVCKVLKRNVHSRALDQPTQVAVVVVQASNR